MRWVAIESRRGIRRERNGSESREEMARGLSEGKIREGEEGRKSKIKEVG